MATQRFRTFCRLTEPLHCRCRFSWY